MNCANHADASAVAYCRTCGKPLCANCTRPVRGVIYCEDCLGARMESGAPAAGFVSGTVPPAGAVPPTFAVPPAPPIPPRPGAPAPGSGPNPTVAGILAGVFPFGVGAVYTGQYAKGLAHLAIFGLLIAGCNVSGSDVLPAICGFGIAFFIVYQIFDAVRSARAIQAGLPPPDPYGLAASFGAGTQGTKSDMSKIPTGAIILIVLGVLFLLHTAGFFAFGFDRFWPLLLMFLGAWLFARNYGLARRGLHRPTITQAPTHGACSAVHGRHALSAGDRGCCKLSSHLARNSARDRSCKASSGIRFALGFRRQLSWRSSGAIGRRVLASSSCATTGCAATSCPATRVRRRRESE